MSLSASHGIGEFHGYHHNGRAEIKISSGTSAGGTTEMEAIQGGIGVLSMHGWRVTALPCVARLTGGSARLASPACALLHGTNPATTSTHLPNVHPSQSHLKIPVLKSIQSPNCPVCPTEPKNQTILRELFI